MVPLMGREWPGRDERLATGGAARPPPRPPRSHAAGAGEGGEYCFYGLKGSTALVHVLKYLMKRTMIW